MPKKPYESDTTTFIKSLFVNKPELRKQQLDARSLWWDREQDLKQQAELDKSKIKKNDWDF